MNVRRSRSRRRHPLLAAVRQPPARGAADERDVFGLGVPGRGAQSQVRLKGAASAVWLEYRLRRGDPHADICAREGHGPEQVRRAGEHDDLLAGAAGERGRDLVRGATLVGVLAQRERRLLRGRTARVRVDRLWKPHAVVLDQPARGVDDLRGAAVVVGEGKALQPRIGEVEVEDAAHARAPPSVQRLILVADAVEAVLRRRQDPHQQLLRGLDVLVLVDQHVPEAGLPSPPELGVLAQRSHRDQHEVVEVVDRLLGEVTLVQLVDPRERGTVRPDRRRACGTRAASPSGRA